MADVICVDLSHYQTGFNFQAFKDGGGLGVILKASEGVSSRDADYPTFKQRALAAGLVLASYHFLRAGDMKAQAQFFLSVVNPRPSERVVADHEDGAVGVEDLVTFLQEIQRLRPDLQLTVYSGHLIKQQLGSTRHDWLAGNTSLWLAQYASQPSWPTATWPNWSLWQYTDQGKVAGFNGNVDCDRFNGSDENFRRWVGPQPAAGAPTAASQSEGVKIAMTIHADRPVTLVVNGVLVEISPSGPAGPA